VEIEFECGVKVANVAMPGMAIRAHIGQCENAACQAECVEMAEKYKNVQVD
jgi:hypothetical protein